MWLKKVCGILIFLQIMLLGICSTYAQTNIKIPVLLYHGIYPDTKASDNPMVISQSQFAAEMQYLKDNNFTTVSLYQLNGFLKKGIDLPSKSVVITFDDGYLNNYLYAYPILKQYGFTATIFLLTSAIQEDSHNNFLGWHDIRQCADTFLFGNHTYKMHDEDQNGQTLFITKPIDAVQADLNKSIGILYSHMLASEFFAYPCGQYNDALINLVKNSGCQLAFTTESKYVTRNSDPYKLGRMYIVPGTDLNLFAKIVNGRF